MTLYSLIVLLRTGHPQVRLSRQLHGCSQRLASQLVLSQRPVTCRMLSRLRSWSSGQWYVRDRRLSVVVVARVCFLVVVVEWEDEGQARVAVAV
jgi:hypothetical protein